MAELILERITELQALPQDQHLFCPREGSEDGSAYYEEDLAGQPPDDDDAAAIAERNEKLKQAEERKWATLDALQILAFEGPEAKPYHDWISERMNGLMTSCDVCIRVFHKSRAEWKARLVEQYEEDNIESFLRIIDDFCLKRIISGLSAGQAALEAAEPKKRTVRYLPSEAMYAFFEALGCDALLRNEEQLQRHFDRPFELVQTRKRLKLPTMLPAMTRFMFSSNEVRRAWALDSWSDFRRDVLPSEFEWAVRPHLEDAMWRVQMTNLDLPFTPHFWEGVKLIITKVDKRVVAESIRGLEGNFHKLILDHFSLRSDAFLDVVATFELLLEKSPTDFWDAMNAVTPSIATVVEQVLNGPKLKEMLSQASEGDAEKMGEISQAFQWIEPFLSSIKPANLTPACKAFANFLFNHLQSSAYPPTARTRCIKEGLRVLDYSFKKMNQGKNVNDFVGQPTVNGMLEILSTHIQAIVSALKRSDNPEARDNRALALSMIEQAFTLESQSLAVERKLILEKKPSPTETPPSRPIWKAVLSAIDSKSIDLAIRLLVAGRNLIGLEPLFMKPSAEKIPRTVQHFNDRFKLLSQSITDVVERLGEMDPERLGALFEKSTEASAIMSTLFSSTEDTRLAAVELIKVISLKDERREALQHILHTYYKNVLQGVSDSCRQVTRKRAFAPAPSLIKTCSDIIDVMCNSQDGLLRSRNLNSEDGAVTMNLWKNLWNTLTMIFRTTEDWSNLGAHDKNTMMDFCRDTMQFADQLFDANSIFLTALKDATQKEDDSSDLLIELLDLPGTTMGGMAKWLRLRDEFLSTKSVTLISKLLIRLQKVSVEVDPETLSYIDKILSGAIKAKLRLDQQAELEKALEIHLGHPKVKEEEVEKQARQVPISKWMATGSIADAKAREADVKSKLLAQATSASTAYNSVFQARREATRAREAQVLKQNENKAAQMSEFKKKRQAEQERLKAERAAAVAKAKKARGLSEHTAEAGSGLEGLGVLGKDQAPKGEGLMHSSDESEAEEEDFDAELFGMKEKKPRNAPKTNIINEVKVQMPVKKRKVIRSVKDMRARLAPDLSPLHKVILSWDFFHEGDFPPNSRPDIYTKISNTFRTPNDYQAAFEPLLTLEAWQSFVNFRGENEFKPYEIRIVSRASVDAFQEVSSTMTHQENKNLNVSEGDIVLLSQSKMPSPEDRYCLARVFRVQRKQAHLEVSYRVLPSRSNGLQSALIPNGTVFGSKIQSMTPLEREYAALLGLQYYDLCDEIIHAKPSPLLTYKENQLEPLIANYNVNRTQAKAVKSAMDNDAFTLIQGPPGTGKTKTIVAIVGALLSDSMRTASYGGRSDAATKKLLVCAPSNAAVDELVMRFKQGIKTLNGQERKINVVRLGRSDAINANVQDITLDELVNKRLGVNNDKGKDAEAKRKIFDEHKQISEQIRQVHAQLDAGTLPGPEASKLQDDLSALRRRKQQLGSKIDSVKDEERVQSRNAELTRRRAQEHVLGEAHVICATLSGSGHDMFQGLSIEFETVIVDEAAQCVEMSALIPLKYGCSKCILVGDPKQLPPTVFSRHAARFQYEQSLFVRMQNNHPNDVHLLDTQYRMHPEISLFSSQTFYDGRLLDGDNMAGLRQRPWHTSALLSPYQFYDVQGRHSTAPGGRSSRNEAEINVAMQLYNRLTMDYKDIDFRGKIGIITPYKEQLRALKMRFSQQYGPDILTNVEFNTTDAFQGRECEIIIFSCVKASATGSVGFLKDIRRMNVGLTRAKSSLWVLGNAPTLCRGEFWNKLVVDAKKRGRFVEGNLMAMLGKHSSAFPAPNQSAAPPAPKIKQEPETYTWEPQMKSAEEFRASLGFGVKKEEPQADVKPVMKFEDTKPDLGFDGDGKRKMDLAFDEDIDMMDAKSASASRSRSPAEASRRSTPTARSSATPAPDTANNSAAAPGSVAPQAPAGPMSGMAQPKVRKRPRKEVNPLMVRQPTKKPRPS